MEVILVIVHVLVALVIIGLVLLQHGKGADMGAAFGSGSAGSLFGASGSANFLSRSTAIAAAIFFATSVFLTYSVAQRAPSESVMQKTQPKAVEPGSGDNSVPSAPTTPAPGVPGSPSADDGSAAKEAK